MGTKPSNLLGENIQKRILKKFLEPWKRREDVLGILLVGSYATGLNTNQSDIDVCIILRDTARHWQRGNIIISGFLIEYGAYTVSYLEQLQERDLRNGKRLRTRMLATGQILFDRANTIEQLQKEAQKLLREKLPQQNTELIEMRKYYLWDQLDNLHDLANRGAPGFVYAYYSGLQEILICYATFLCLEIPCPARIHSFLTDMEFQRRYGIALIPDATFLKLFGKAMPRPSLKIFEQLTNHVHKHMGGFRIDGWTLRGLAKHQVRIKPKKTL